MAGLLAAAVVFGSGASESSQELAFEQMRLAAQLSRGHSRRDFRPCDGAWNSTMAAEHEAAFMLCVAGDEQFEKPDARIAHELLPIQSQPLSSVSEGLMLSESQRFCNCTRELHNAASCGHASAQDILDEYEPWCLVLDACPAVARALLHSAQSCQTAGMRGDNHSVLCVAAGANECASRVESLFEATHAMHGWVNDTAARLEDLRRLRSRWHGLWAVLPSWLAPQERAGAFDQLSGCMGSVAVDESQLHLPMSLLALSGNGSFAQYSDFFRARCGVEYQLWEGLMDSAMSLSGMDYAQDEWELGHRLTALGILTANVLVLCVACCAIVRLVRRGHCYRACSPSSREERRGLKGEDEEGRSASVGEAGAGEEGGEGAALGGVGKGSGRGVAGRVRQPPSAELERA